MKPITILLLILLSTNLFANEDQWVYRKLGGDKLKEAWNKLGDKKVIVAVIDTGVDYTHTDLGKQMWINKAELNGLPGVDDDNNGYVDDIRGYNFVEDNTDPMDDIGHGTHVAGIIAARHNGIGIDGVNPNAVIMPLKIVTRKKNHISYATDAIYYAVDNGAKIINCSWGETEKNEEFEKAVNYAYSKGVIIVAAAGNSGLDLNDRFRYFADFGTTIMVTSHGGAGKKITYKTNFGTKKIDIAAPGAYIRSTVPGNKYDIKNGTSMAAPFVTGAISLLFSLGHDLSTEEVRDRLYKTGVESSDFKKKLKSGKRLNVYDFVMSSN